MLLLASVVGAFLIKLDSWTSLIAYSCCYVIAFTALLWHTYLDRSERELFSAPLKKLIHLLKHEH